MKAVRKDFPLLQRKVNQRRIVYLDSTATALKPKSVVAALNSYYTEYSANVFRGLYSLSEKATQKYEAAREKIAALLNASSSEEIIFTRSATEAINLIAYTWGRLQIGAGDKIVTTLIEHHSNFLPWQQLCLEKGAILEIIDVMEDAARLTILNRKLQVENAKLKVAVKKAKLLAITHVSNVLGTINPLKEIIQAAKKINPAIIVLVDGAQAVPHMKVDVQKLACDFYVFSGHKMLGPTGIGVLWGRRELLEAMPPFNFGGEMVRATTLTTASYKRIPHKFEAGTPHIAGAIGLGAAIDYLQKIGMEEIRRHEVEITGYGLSRLEGLKRVRIYGPQAAQRRGGVVAFNLFNKKGRLIHPHDVAQILSQDNICIRSGHHCAMPLHTRLGIPASARASFYLYNCKQDVDMLINGINRVLKILA